ncbi:MAG: tyrosinase [Sphingomonadales bacterium]|nr:tyrosinase [Sphingomonadales bacterium]
MSKRMCLTGDGACGRGIRRAMPGPAAGGMAMTVEIAFPKYDSKARAFVTWRPVEAKIRLVSPAAGTANLPVTVSAKTSASGGQLAFATMLTHLGASSIGITLPGNGAPVSVWIGGRPPNASTTHGDVSVEVRATASGAVLATHALMVRVRKNANKLSVAERDRFLSALAALNGSGKGRYQQFRDMHVGGLPDQEAHGGAGFLAWHRAYLLDLERELQEIDGEVTLPYWRFDEAAPNVFAGSFMGTPDSLSRVQFASGNPLRNWIAVDKAGVERGVGVGPLTVPTLQSERQTIAPGGVIQPTFAKFRDMQWNPHGWAHTAHNSGWIFSPGTAPKDPLFFLLHCNVDRLWAKWQWAAKKHDPADPASFDTVPAGPPAPPGHHFNDLLWPWCGPSQAGRPKAAPGGALVASPMTAAPGPSPRVSQMIDYFATVSGDHQAFAYDDVPFQI